MRARVVYGARRAAPWLIGVAAVGTSLMLYIVVISEAPYWFNPALRNPPSVRPSGAPPSLSPSERLTAAHNARFLVVSIAGALVVLTGLAFTAFNYRLAHRGRPPNGSPRPSSGSTPTSYTSASAVSTPSTGYSVTHRPSTPPSSKS